MERLFEEAAEFTFPPPRYGLGSLQSTEAALMHRQRSFRGCDDRGIATLDVRHYLPEEIKLKVEGGKILVDGKHYSEGEFGFESSEFHRKYDLPEGCEAESVFSRISEDGVLTIEASKPNTQQRSAMPAGFGSSGGEVTNTDDKEFSVSLDMSSFTPDEINIKVVGNNVVVSAKHESETKGHYTSQQFNRHFVLPKDLDMSTVSSSVSKDGKLHIKAERKSFGDPEERQIHMKDEDEITKM